MKILSSIISEYRGSWVEQKGRKLILSKQERSHVFSLVCDSSANRTSVRHQKNLPDVSSLDEAHEEGPGLAACWIELVPRQQVKSKKLFLQRK